MAEHSKHHKAIHQHTQRMRQHASAINDSADKIEQALAAMKGPGQDQPDQAQPQGGPMPGGVSPLGGTAQT